MDKEAIVTENEDGTVNYHIPLESYQDGDDYVERSVTIVTDEEDIDDVSLSYDVDGSATSITVVNENEETSTLE